MVPTQSVQFLIEAFIVVSAGLRYTNDPKQGEVDWDGEAIH